MVRTKSSDLSLIELQELLAERIEMEQKRLPKLKQKRDELAEQLEEIDKEIGVLEMSGVSATPARTKRGRKPGPKAKARAVTAKKTSGAKRGRKPGAKKGTRRSSGKRGNKMTIPAAITKVLSESTEPMTTEAIRNAIKDQKLIKRISKSFGQQVGIALSKHDEFKRKGRGLYSL